MAKIPGLNRQEDTLKSLGDDALTYTADVSQYAIKINPKDPYNFKIALCVFTSAEDPDAAGDFFTTKSDLGSAEGSDLYWEHGLDEMIGLDVVGKAAFEKDDAAVWMNVQLDRSNKYAKYMAKLAKDQKLGASSGTAKHLVIREPVKDSEGKVIANWLKKWPLGVDASLTVRPCESKTVGTVTEMKSYVPAMNFKSIVADPENMDPDASLLDDSSLPTYTYPMNATIGHTISSKMATDHGRFIHQAYRNRTISTPEYSHMMGAFGPHMRAFHMGLNPEVSDRKIDEWDDYDAQYKSQDMVGMKTMKDACHACMTRSYNAAADHMLTRGYITGDEHKAMRDHFESHRDGYLKDVDKSIMDRDLKMNGTRYPDIKSFGDADALDARSSLETQTNSLLSEIDGLTKRARGFGSRMMAIKTSRMETRKGDLGPTACSRIDDVANELKALIQSLEDMKPSEEKSLKALASEAVQKAREFRKSFAA